MRKWFLPIGPDDMFTATADDIVGKAHGVVSGSTVKLTNQFEYLSLGNARGWRKTGHTLIPGHRLISIEPPHQRGGQVHWNLIATQKD